MFGDDKVKRILKSDVTNLIQLAGKKLAPQITSKLIKENDILEIQRLWPKIVSETLAAHSLPYQIRKDELLVQVDHSIFAQQLQMLSANITTKLSSSISIEIRRLKTRIGKIYWSNKGSAQAKVSDIMSPTATMTQATEAESEQTKIIQTLIEEIEKI